jgi:primary-amine oxidase
VVYDRAGSATYEARVDLGTGQVTDWSHLPGVQPAIMIEEIMELEAIVKKDPAAVAALARHGVEDLELLQIDPWSTGTLPIDGVSARRRVIRASAYVRRFPEDNGYARPVGNLVFVIDCDDKTVAAIQDGDPIPLPPESGNYDVASVGPLRTDLRALEIHQPDGPSFTVSGNVIDWQRWRLHVHVDPVEGLVISDVSYLDGDRRRSILHRASISEMVVPYGDTSNDFYFRNVFDAGEYNLGKTVGSLTLGCDCLGEIRYLDAVLADEGGTPQVIRNAICMHEEDYGILWKHWNFRYQDAAEVRRSRRFVVSAIHTIGNYEYGFFWYLYLDGSSAPSSRRSWTHRTTSTCSTCGSTSRWTGRTTPCTKSTRSDCRWGRTIPTATRSSPARRRSPTNARPAGPATRRPPAPGRSSTRR